MRENIGRQNWQREKEQKDKISLFIIYKNQSFNPQIQHKSVNPLISLFINESIFYSVLYEQLNIRQFENLCMQETRIFNCSDEVSAHLFHKSEGAI